MTFADLLPYVIGAGAYWLLGRLGVKVPLPTLPVPVPAPAPDSKPMPAADKPAVDFLKWLLEVKAGLIKIDELDRVVLVQVRSALADAEKQ